MRTALISFFEKILNSDFMPHGHCFFWRPDILWLQLISNAGIALAYFSIPIMLWVFIRKRKDLPFNWMFLLFAAFILCCGVTHVMDIVTLWLPVYRLDGVFRAITAAVSITTAVLLFPLIPKALALRSPQELEEKNQELEATSRKLIESERLKDEFLARVSHELRTPLTLILAPLETLTASHELSEQQVGLVRTVQNNALRLLQMITELLDFSKLQAGHMEVHRESTDVPSLTKALIGDFAPAFFQKKLLSLLECERPVSPVLMDRYLYERILFNLLSNAVKFTPEGGSVTVGVRYVEDTIELSVRDTGPGIAPECIEFLFQPFRQVEESTTRRFEGTGLGLSITKEFAKLLGGDVVVESTLGKGSEFRVRLPAPVAKASSQPIAKRNRSAMAKVPATATVPPTGFRKHGAARVLIAEDNPELSAYIASLLQHFCDIRIAEDGKKALAIARTWPADLVISDIMMPELDGLSLCRELKQNPGTAATCVILLTALAHQTSLLKGWEAGADEYLFKPFHPLELVTRVRSMIAMVEQRKLVEKEHARHQQLEQFAYFASHDLREPLRTLSQMSELLRVRFAEGRLPEAMEYMGFIIEAADRMQNIIDDLVSYSSVSSETIPSQPVALDAILSTVKDQLQESIDETKATVTSDPLPVISGSAAHMTLLLRNLLSNSIKFHGSDPPQVHISCESIDDGWLFSVRDNGIGFDPKFVEHVFVVFKRLHGRKQYSGTGMGLAICRRIVERRGGKIWAESCPGRGTTIHFWLPVNDVSQSHATGKHSMPVHGSEQVAL